MRNAVVVFTKVPVAGETKTRLTVPRGGMLSQEEAVRLYEGCVIDVINVCLAADCGEVWVCYNAGGNRSCLERILCRTNDRQRIAGIYSDQGGSFDQCMQFAADHLLRGEEYAQHFDSIIIVGGDIPSLQPDTLHHARTKLECLSTSPAGRAAVVRDRAVGSPIGAALVQGACQEGGFSLVGLTASTPFNFSGVFYNTDGITALEMLVQKAAERSIPFGSVEMIPDIDLPVDLASMLPVLHALRLEAEFSPAIIPPSNTLAVLDELGLESAALPPVR